MEETKAGTRSSPSYPEESQKERLDRNVQELLESLRVALPGVQVLFAFLLVVPFQQGWTEVTPFQKDVYFATLIATTIASILLIGPSARARTRFRKGDKNWVVVTGNRLAEAGFAFLGLAMAGAILLISDVLFSLSAAVITSAALGSLLIWLWFVAPGLRAVRELGDAR